MKHTFLGLLVLSVISAGCSDDDPGGNTGGSSSGGGAGVGAAAGAGGSAGASGAGGQSGAAGAASELFKAGPQGVGYRQATLQYTPKGSTESRNVKLEIWYPAKPGSAALVTYEVAGIVKIQSKTAMDAPSPEGTSHPVLAYSHGNAGVALVGYAIGEHMASHGFVVIAPDHTGNTVLDSSNDYAQNLLYRPQDVSASLDYLDSGLGGDPLDKISDLTRTLVVGHSFGTYSTLSVAGAKVDVANLVANCATTSSCATVNKPEVQAALQAGFLDPRVDAIVPQSPIVPLVYTAGSIAGVSVPTLLMSGRLDITTTHELTAKPTWAELDGAEDLWLDVEKGGHYTFITVCDDAPPALLVSLNAAPDGCNSDFIPISEAVPVLNAYILGFARAHALGESAWRDVLRGPAFSPGFILQTK